MVTLTKVCARCKSPQPLTEFYARSGQINPSEPGHYISECKTCMRERSRNLSPLRPTEPRTATEVIAINYLHSKGIPCLPGKAISYPHVDIVAFGCIRVEVKWARMDYHRKEQSFKFSVTPSQVKHGYRGDVILLVCEYEQGYSTFHLFPVSHPVFYIGDRLKSGFVFTPGVQAARKNRGGFVVMTQPLMDQHEDNVALLWDLLSKVSEKLSSG